MSTVSSITSYAPKVFGYAKRIVKAAPDAIFGTGAEVAGEAMRAAKGNVLVKGKAGFKALEGMQKTGSFWSRATANLGLIKTMPAKYMRAARIAGKGIFGQAGAGIKGLFKGLGKNMPFVAAASTLLFELPNIWKATKEQGIGQGVAEIGKAGARLAGGAALAAVGSAICPGIGTMIGWFAGDWLTSKIVGKSYSEKKAEAEEALAQAQNQTMQPQTPTGMPPTSQTTFEGNNPFNQYGMGMTMSNPMANNNNNYENPYENDIMMQQMNFNTLA